MEFERTKKLLELNFKDGEKVKISPVGEVVGYDGRTFKVVGEALVASISANGLDIPLDENHYFGEATGWFKRDSFEVREDGVYASLELTKKGKELVENKSYRYLSPVYEMGSKGNEVVGLDSVGLVNRPNLLNDALNKKENKVTDEEIENLKKENERLEKELEDLKKDKESEGGGEQTPTTETTPEANDKEVEKLAKNVAKLTDTVTEMSKQLKVFGKTDLEENEKEKTELSENDKKMAEMLGLSHKDYLESKGAA